VVEIVQPKRKKFRNNVDDTTDEEMSRGSIAVPDDDGTNLGQFVPKNENLYNKRRLMTAPD
jgi:hypothetical protein